MRLEIEILFQPLSDLRFAVQRNPYASSSTEGDNALVMSHTFDSLTFYACVLNTPAEILSSQNPGIDATVLSHMAQAANMNNFLFHNVFKCFKFSKPSLSSSAANTHRFDILNSVRRIWLQVCPEPVQEGTAHFGCRDWTQSVVYAYAKAYCNYFIDAQWNYVNCVMNSIRMQRENWRGIGFAILECITTRCGRTGSGRETGTISLCVLPY